MKSKGWRYVNRRTCIYFRSKHALDNAIDFLINLDIRFTYIRAMPMIQVHPSLYKKYSLDLYLEDIVGVCSKFRIKLNKKRD